MSDQGTSDAYRHLPHSSMDEGTSQPIDEDTASTGDIFVFKAKSEQPFLPKKRCWYSKARIERRKRLRPFQK